LTGLRAKSARYDGEVRAVDAVVGRITAAIEKSVGMDRSLVVLTSDHGEAFGEHDMFEHGHTLHGEVTRVPLVMCGPSLPRGRSIDDNVRTLDILPTILDVAEYAGLEPDAVMGKSLLPVIEGKGKPRMVYSEGMLYGSTERSLIVGDRKLMFDKQGKRFKLYDLAADPGELVDIGGREKGRVRAMSARLRKFHRRLSEDYDARRRKGRTIKDHAREKEKEEEMMRALRSLGYINE
jgi:arylsulfatase A-like enzyme